MEKMRGVFSLRELFELLSQLAIVELTGLDVRVEEVLVWIVEGHRL
jgi:hypothetical protein